MVSVIGRRRASVLEAAGLALSGAAILLGAMWIRTWGQPYLLAATIATLAVVVIAWRSSPRGWWWSLAAVLIAFVAAAWNARLAFDRSDGVVPPERAQAAGEAVRTSLRDAAREAQRAAQRMLSVAPTTAQPFLALEARLPPLASGEAAAVVLEGDRPYGWIGLMRLPYETMNDTVGVVRNEFYTVLYASASRAGRRAVVTYTVHAEPPGDRLARDLLGILAARVGAERFDVVDGERLPGDVALAAGADTAGWVRPVYASAAAIRLKLEERRRVVAAALLALAVLVGTGFAWRRPAGTRQRFAALAVTLALVALAPLNALSNAAAVFNPSYYFSSFGGPLTSNVAALALTGLVASLAVFAVQRSQRRVLPLGIAALLTLVCVVSGPYLLRALARGISVPPRGVPATLWIAWDIALFLPTLAVLMLGAWSAQGIRRWSRLSPGVASVAAGIASLLALLVMQAPGRFPQWYVVLWFGAAGALALSRRTRLYAVHTAFIAACAATTLVWGAVTRKRVELAQSDVTSLATAEPGTIRLLERLAAQVADAPVPRSLPDLLKIYVASELAYAGNPVELAIWRTSAERPDAELIIADLRRRQEGERPLVTEASQAGVPILREFTSSQGIQLVLAVPLDSQRVLSVVAAPRTRLIADDPFAALLGLEVPGVVEPAYRLAVAEAEPHEPVAGPVWARRGYELHGDWTLQAGTGRLHAHVEVELRALDALVTRGALLVLLDLAVFGVLWVLVATADGGLRRWLRARTWRWRGSYRARLTLTLFAAFVAPSVAFAIWTYERLNDEDLLSRALLVQENLRSVRLRDVQMREADRDRGELPVLWYRRGQLAGASNPLHEKLAPLGIFVDPVAAQDVVFGQEEFTSRRVSVGPVLTLVGYRVAGDGMVLATPARRSELTLERQQRDLLALLALALVIGAVIALWISGVAARGFAQPISALRTAAEDVSAGARELPSLGRAPPPSEFKPVYATFRQMAVDLSDSRHALQDAQRRTEAVLRDVGSGVVAFSRHGRILLANPRAEQILGTAMPPGQSPGRGHDALAIRVQTFLAGDADMELFDQELRGRQLRGRLTRLAAGDGGAVLTIDDVTDLARAQRVFAWGEMARQIAHEIKNPLTPIRLGVQHVRRAHADAHPGFGEILERNVSRILEEIDRLDEIARTFAKFGTHPDDSATSDIVDVSAIAHDVVELERMGESGVRWEVDAEDPVWARSRDAELREVLLNVLENARHARARVVRVRVTDGDGRARITVEDDGEGVTPEIMTRVFEPHFSTRTSGSGLGLAISRRLVESWGGTIRLLPGHPHGTTVEIALVAAPAP